MSKLGRVVCVSLCLGAFAVLGVGCASEGDGDLDTAGLALVPGTDVTDGLGPWEYGCVETADCQEGLFCSKTLDACGAKGRCVPKPDACPDVWAPVCGCDGKTYSNKCDAAAAGVAMEHVGECKPAPCKADKHCADGEYCAKDTCGPGVGECVEKPEVCTKEYMPVCGCDGQTYGNDCEAAAAGVNVEHEGECDAVCSLCVYDWQCGGGQFCMKDGCDGVGMCASPPEACAAVYDPVCGCDGKTYGNSCEASAQSVNVAHEGACESNNACGGIQGLPCDEGQFCEFAPGTCDIVDNMGECVDVPEACPEIWAPVCGCDGKTYGNDCERQAAQVQLAHEGECKVICNIIIDCIPGWVPVDTTGDGCPDSCEPGPCDGNEDCPLGYCQMDKCYSGEGVCAEKPQACPDVWDPVCGCDGNTYGNSCEAAAAGVNVLHEGECELQPDCEHNAWCDEGEYCAKDGCSGVGFCTPMPGACIQIYDPVCGCDGNTYGNACTAAAAGVNVLHEGECESPKTCGGFIGLPCDDGQFCELEPDSCNVADAMGQCVDVPMGCPDVWDPVCGCDGKTYGNDCERQAASAQLAHEGACDATASTDK